MSCIGAPAESRLLVSAASIAHDINVNPNWTKTLGFPEDPQTINEHFQSIVSQFEGSGSNCGSDGEVSSGNLKSKPAAVETTSSRRAKAGAACFHG